MKEAKHILALIYQFLIRKERPEEKEEILDWYERYHLDYDPSQEHIEHTGQSVKHQVFDSIKQEASVRPLHRLWRPLAAAVAIFMLTGLGYLFLGRENAIVADTDLLASISPSDPQAKITLESGQIIDLEKMAIDSCIKLDHIEIRKDSTGQITYVQNSKNKTEIGSNTIETPSNANYTLNLSDGTIVMLNANTKLKYPNSFGGGDRTVELDGEAYFIVSKTKEKQKFFVKTQQQVTEVLGTRFNIKTKKGRNIEHTTLEEGSIRVTNSNTSEGRTIQPGQQAILNNAHMKVEQVDLEPFLAWTKGYFYLDGQNTSNVLQEIAEWYNIDIDYTITKNNNKYKGKIPKKLSLDKLIQLLEYTDLKAKPTIQNDRIKLLIK